MKFLVIPLAISVIVLGLAAGWQHARYLGIRRGPVQDLQPLWYSSEAFHVVTFLAVPPDRDVIDEVRGLRNLIEAGGDARMVYAGQAAFVALASAQLPERSWNATFLVQYPSREAYEAQAATPRYRDALAALPHYSHGMKRWRGVNLALPQFLLTLRIRDLVTFAPARFPLTPAEATEQLGGRDREVEFAKLAALKPRGEDAIVVVNLLQNGSPEQQAADRAYGLAMAGGFAEGRYGPMHMGRAVRIEGDASFDNVALVYYPGIDFMQSLVGSTFFQGIVGGKQPGDTQAVVTIPILGEL